MLEEVREGEVRGVGWVVVVAVVDVDVWAVHRGRRRRRRVVGKREGRKTIVAFVI